MPSAKAAKNPRPTLVCMVGIDGAGKSTLAKGLVTIMEEQGTRCKYVWGGFTSSFTIFKPLVAVMKASVFRGNRLMQQSSTKGTVLRSSALSTVYQYLALSDYIVQGLVRIRLPLAFGTNVICDRYIYDLTTSIGVLLDYPLDRTLGLLDRCLRFLPDPDLVFLIDLPEAIAYERKDDTISLNSLSLRRATYLEMAKRHPMIVLDGSREPEELKDTVATEVSQYIMGEG